MSYTPSPTGRQFKLSQCIAVAPDPSAPLLPPSALSLQASGGLAIDKLRTHLVGQMRDPGADNRGGTNSAFGSQGVHDDHGWQQSRSQRPRAAALLW